MISIHPAVDHGVPAGKAGFAGATLTCHCKTAPVVVEIGSDCLHNHVCGCTKCWKPAGATFSQVAVVTSDKVKIVQNGDKLKVVDESALIQRHACTGCGVHMQGPVTRPNHPFTGLTFIHTELGGDGWAAPTFAAFVSSVIESGTNPDSMGAIRARLTELGLPPYDCLSPGLMDYIATFVAKANGVLKA
jgi:S-(hydroxymethyl)glutathione synthase